MKRNSSNQNLNDRLADPSATRSRKGSAAPDSSHDWASGDPLWDLLSEASDPEPDPFFARNVVRHIRLEKPEPLRSRLLRLVRSRNFALGASSACLCAAMAYQFWPATQSPPSLPTDNTMVEAPIDKTQDLTENLSEIVLEETLLAAAEDPSMFTRHEVVSMLGL
ncbi:hypothetical protein HW115_13450 [Verrucomicrobiaceae bacterium N1E253]|uniref:Uncharacterized protein n=1 Tax=Oceaniferula marina TaxID=2748318 RepID=A0A851GI78_9BACT|nr:hypothetical protein [Oceaniferula marina]NWK56622.1 hypothetical protein [Oceaniferula marina]